MLTHHGLYPPRKLMGKTGILEFIHHVGSIQFDPINIVGRNPDLVLQSRVLDYRPSLLDGLLYEERKLIDGWDKMASIYSVEDWPFFSRRRCLMNQSEIDHRRPSKDLLEEVLKEVSARGPVSSLELTQNQIVDWHWGPTKASRAALESLFSMGKIGVHHRVNNRRVFDIIHRLIPQSILDLTDPFTNDADYETWHFLRRLVCMGLVSSKSGEHWHGILGVKSKERQLIIHKLIEAGEIISLEIDEIPNQLFYMRKCDYQNYKSTFPHEDSQMNAAIIGALDNLIWDRGLIRQIFEFKYIWEVYKPKAKREFGYYVLPIIYGNRFIARFEPKFDKKRKIFTVENWWWEGNIELNSAIEVGLQKCFIDFITYLDAAEIKLGDTIKHDRSLSWFGKISNYL
jgi:uncharacterized protein YcaQ